MAAGSPNTIPAAPRDPSVSDAEVLAIARQELVSLSELIARLEQIFADLSKKPSRRELGWLAGKGALTLEQALAPTDEDEIKAWGL